ncbi:MAG TPA: UDP-2,3-diacylglucosamine diphosphatase [Haliscomenobacter sp.]|uniref:UDP-2,3-diacylglucosamine diphosphatase n=1 Tax=Haliscomenobacter sp. TaxID=2717303 RepID=UPI002CE37308|nr:UDP-2,3-diacylglucosamine diphosphatase [Haliscomenobacter sp.]HOY19101.1 UDP-2,3-diacylglucosamine diphosphatase [Haliscomenobacter sp.]
MKRELDIVILSDAHLGTYGCHAVELLNYLRNIKVGALILNGDFIDMWQFRKSYFPKEHLDIIQRILRMAAKGTQVYYITGNHDDALRRYSNFSSGNIHLRDTLELQIKGKSYWIFHGDIFDLFIKYSPFISKLGAKGYDYLIVFNRWINKLRAFFGLPRLSFSQKIKYSVKEAIKFVDDFEEKAIELAAEKGYDYVVCGHIHRAQIKSLERNGKPITYLNSGDWIESLTALEYKWGQWSIYEYNELDFVSTNPKLRVHTAAVNEDDDDEATTGEAISTAAMFEQIVNQAAPKKRAAH